MVKRTSRIVMSALCGTLILLSLGVASANDSPARISPPSSPGEALYVTKGCYQCHGLVGQGSVMSGPGLVPMRLTSEAFAWYVRNPARTMPPYSRDTLTNAELWEIERYVRTFPAAKALEEIPLLARYAIPAASGINPSRSIVGKPSLPITSVAANAASHAKGEAVYATYCAACHGTQSTRGTAAPLLGHRLKRTWPAAIEFVKNPSPAMPKLFPAPLSSSDVEEVVAYIRSKAPEGQR